MPGFAVVDCETTGLDASADRVIEVAVLHLDVSGRLERRWSTLVDPGCEVRACHVHGLSEAALAGAPSFAAIAPWLAELLAGRAFAAHNAAFDSAFLNAEFARAGLDFAISPEVLVCTMDLSRIYLPFGRHSLSAVADRAGLSIAPSHRALADAEVAAQLLRFYLEREAAGARYEQSAQTRNGGIVRPASWLRALAFASSGSTRGSLEEPASATGGEAWTSSSIRSGESALA